MNLLGTADLMNRWNYTRQGLWGLAQKIDFPKPVALVNNSKMAIYQLQDIELYEKEKPWLFNKNLKEKRKKTFYANRHKKKPVLA